MRIAMTGGGSGGHITPILAVAGEIKKSHPEDHITYIGQRGDAFADVVAKNPVVNQVYSVSAGKFRRYHGEGIRQLVDFPTIALNIRDSFRVLAGIWQSFWFFRKSDYDVLFTRGGFVSVPVAIGAKLNGIPFITHDSDALASLANRLIARWATKNAVAVDAKFYPYEAAKVVNVGVPVAGNYKPVTLDVQQAFKQRLGYEKDSLVLLVTGGGLGAARLNSAAITVSKDILKKYPNLYIVHTAGTMHEESVSTAYSSILSPSERKRVLVLGYTTELASYSGAADVVVARGGATNMAELAALNKACIIVPNPQLTGGHQLKNVRAYTEKGAVIGINEPMLTKNHELLRFELEKLFDDPKLRLDLAKRIAEFSRPDATRKLAELVYEAANKKNK